MKSSRNWCGSEGKDVSIEAKPLEALFVFDTEAMLLVNDNQSQL